MPFAQSKTAHRRKSRRNELDLLEPWIDPPVPNGYWHDVEHRRQYLKWLGKRLRFTKTKDWYRISTKAFQAKNGGGVLVQWNHSAVAAVKEPFPKETWHEWLFEQAPRGFWKDRSNHRRYLDWLAERLKIKRFEDWYHVTNGDFARHAGASMLIEYRSCLSRALMECFPEHDWKEWLFDVIPAGFWREPANQRRYLTWLGEKLGFDRPTDWYQLSADTLVANYGQGLLRHYRCSIPAIVRKTFPHKPGTNGCSFARRSAFGRNAEIVANTSTGWAWNLA